MWPDKSYPLGSTYDGFGTNFAVFSEVVEQVELCLFGGEVETGAVKAGDPVRVESRAMVVLRAVD